MSDDLINSILEADIVRLSGLGDASPDEKDRALSEAKNLVLSGVISRIRSRLSPELRGEFEQLFGTDDETMTKKDMMFLKEHVPDFDALILEETLAFKKGVMDAVQEIKEKTADESQKINGILNGLKG